MCGVYTFLKNNVGTAFQISQVLVRDRSSFFNWNVTPSKFFVSLRDFNFNFLLEMEDLLNIPETGLMRDASHGFPIHSPFASVAFKDEPNFDQTFLDMKQEFDYLTKIRP